MDEEEGIPFARARAGSASGRHEPSGARGVARGGAGGGGGGGAGGDAEWGVNGSRGLGRAAFSVAASTRDGGVTTAAAAAAGGGDGRAAAAATAADQQQQKHHHHHPRWFTPSRLLALLSYAMLLVWVDQVRVVVKLGAEVLGFSVGVSCGVAVWGA